MSILFVTNTPGSQASERANSS